MAGETILVVEDERGISRLLRYNLEKAGYSVFCAYDGVAGLALAREKNPRLIVLDVLLPRLDGFEVCKRLRRGSRIPILMLTAKKAEVDRILGLELGADDYLTKPFSVRELVARIKALLRRAYPEAQEGERLSFGALEFDPKRFETCLDGVPVALSPVELKLLRALIRAGGGVLTREELLTQAWGIESPEVIETRTVDQHVVRLRRKLGAEAERVVTVKGVGYRFETR